MADENKAPDLSSDPKAQSFLDGFVKQEILVVLVHMPSRMSTSKHLELRAVRAWCEQAVSAFQGKGEHPSSEFIIVEIRKNGLVRTTSLDEFKSEPLLDKAASV